MEHSGNSNFKTKVHSPHTVKVHRSRETTPDKPNPNLDDVFLPKHAPIHIDPKTHEHFQMKGDGTIIHEECIDLGKSVSFGETHLDLGERKRSRSPQFSEAVPLQQGNMVYSHTTGRAQLHPGEIPHSKGHSQQSKGSQGGEHRLINQDFPDDPCP